MSEEDANLISSCVRMIFKLNSVADELTNIIHNINNFLNYLEEYNRVSCVICDVTNKNTIPVLERIRDHNKNAAIIVVADMTVPPYMYVKPTIMPNSLLWKPVTKASAGDQLKPVLKSLCSCHKDDDSDVFIVKSKGEIKRYI